MKTNHVVELYPPQYSSVVAEENLKDVVAVVVARISMSRKQLSELVCQKVVL